MSTNRYCNGKIYKLVSEYTDKIYIGSTCNTLTKRLSKHKEKYLLHLKNKYAYISSFELFQLGDVKIILVEDFQCERREQLLARERHYFDTWKEQIVNVRKPIYNEGETYQPNKETAKIYRVKNSDKIKERVKQYSLEHRDEIILKKKQYYENHKEDIAMKGKEYREKNDKEIKDRIKNYRNKIKTISIHCECGSVVGKREYSSHIKRNKHFFLLSQQEFVRLSSIEI